MLEGASLLPAAVLRNLADKLYEKRKNAALEVEGIIRNLTIAGDHEKITAIINVLTTEFALSPQANHRKGGLIGLAAASVGLASEAAQHLEMIVPPVLNSLTDQDSRVRYYACEALYNIAKVARGDFIVFFNQIFDALCKLSADSDTSVQSAAHLLDRLVKDIVTESDQFSIEEFIPLLRERMNVLNPYVRQFLVGWITVLDSVPDIDMLGFLPDFLDGLFNMLSDSSHEIRQQADSALSEFLQEIKNSQSVDYRRMAEILVQRAGSPDEFTRLTAITWINEFVKLGGEQLVPHYANILGSILPCISDREEKIRAVARETNEELRSIKAEPDNFGIEAVLNIAKREVKNESVETKIEALCWIAVLLDRHRFKVLDYLELILPTLLQSLADPSDEVVKLVLKIQACIASEKDHFCRFMGRLVCQFRTDHQLLETRGALIIQHLCVLLDSQEVYRKLALILKAEKDLEFATMMVQALNLILLTASELTELRSLLKQSFSNADSRDFFVELYTTWCHCPVATISLCLLAQSYQHATSVIKSLGEEDINVKFLVQLDKLVQLLETPIFTYLRLQLLEPRKHVALVKALNGLLMLLPQQSMAFKILRTRLKTVPAYAFMHFPPTNLDVPVQPPMKRMPVGSPYGQIMAYAHNREDGDMNSESSNGFGTIDFQTKLQQFEGVQSQHREHRLQSQYPRLRRGSSDSLQADSERPEGKRGNAFGATNVEMPPRVGWRS